MNRTAFENMLIRFVNRFPKKTSKETTKLYFMEFYKMMLEDLEKNGEFKIPKFGTFKVSYIEEKQIKTNKGKGSKEIQYIYIPARYEIEFIPNEYLRKSINSDFVPITKRKKLKSKEPKFARSASVVNVVANLYQASAKRYQEQIKNQEKEKED